MKRLLVLLTLAAVAAFFVPVASAQAPTLPPLSPELQRIVDCEDPAFPPQSPSGQCATLIEVAREGDNGNQDAWTCTQPLDNYGPRPIIVNHTMWNTPDGPNGQIRLGDTPGSYGIDTCTVISQRVGTGNTVTCNFDQKADLFIQLNGNRTNIGTNNDLVKAFGAHCIEIGDPAHRAGTWIAGQVSSGAHQDCLNSNYVRGLHVYGVVIGDPVNKLSGAHGAGGCWYMDWLDQDGGADNSHHHWNVICDGCILIGSGNGPQGEAHPGSGNTQTGGAGLSFGESDSSGAINSCVVHRRPLVFYATSANGSDFINQNNHFIDRDTDTEADWDDPRCKLDGDPPPPPPLAQCEDGLDNDGDGHVDMADPGCASASDDDEFNEPEPNPEPCDEACVADLRAQVLSLTTQLDACKGKLRNISAFFHHRPKDIFRAYKMHAEVHRPAPCSDRWHG